MRVLELFVDAGESDIGDVVKLREFRHDELADLAAFDFIFVGSPQRRFNACGDGFNLFLFNWTFLAREKKSFENLFAGERLAGSISLDDCDFIIFCTLVRGESLFAFAAFASSAYAFFFRSKSAINNTAFCMLAKWTLHHNTLFDVF